jgi:hypothetical protein
VIAIGGTFRWKEAPRTAPDSIEVALEYGTGFLVRQFRALMNSLTKGS